MANGENSLNRRCRVQIPLYQTVKYSTSNQNFKDDNEDEKTTTFRPKSQV